MTFKRVDDYGHKVESFLNITGCPKYPNMKVAKSALILTHGNADVERSFSESSKSITQDSSCK